MFKKKITQTLSDTIEITKINNKIKSEQQDIISEYQLIGEQVYNLFIKGEDIGEVFKEKCELIDTMNKNISKYKEEIQTIKESNFREKPVVYNSIDMNDNIMFCPNCGNKINKNCKFCTKCGVKMNQNESI